MKKWSRLQQDPKPRLQGSHQKGVSADLALPTMDTKRQDSPEFNIHNRKYNKEYTFDLSIINQHGKERRNTDGEREIDTWSEMERKTLLRGHSRNFRTTTPDIPSCSNTRNRPSHALFSSCDLQR